MSSVQGLTNIGPLASNSLVSEIVDTVNENSTVTNALLLCTQENEQTITDIGDTSELISDNLTLVQQSNFNYNAVQELMNSSGLQIEFLSTRPMKVDPEDVLPAFYFDIDQQILMVYHTGDDEYYPAFGGNSINLPKGTISPATEWMIPDDPGGNNGGGNPPPTPPVAPDCYQPSPQLTHGELRRVVQLPINIHTLTAETVVNYTYILSSQGANNSMTLHRYDIENDSVTELLMIPFYSKDAALVSNIDGTILYIVGGYDSQGLPKDKLHRITLTDNTIAELTDLPVHFVAGDYGYNGDKTKAYFFGGKNQLSSNQNANFSNTIYELDIDTGSFSQIETMPLALNGLAVTKHPDDNDLLYIAGGRTSNNGMNSSLSQILFTFNTETLEIEIASTMNKGRSDGKLYCVGSEMFYIGGYEPKDNNCIGYSNNLVTIYPYGQNWSYVETPKIYPNTTNLFGGEVKDCGYATLLFSNLTERDEIYIIGL